MRVRIGISDSREIEAEVKSEKAFQSEIEAAFSDESARILWVNDSKGRKVGVPVDKIAYFELETEEERRNVGFGAA